jgi:hypothetical protein
LKAIPSPITDLVRLLGDNARRAEELGSSVWSASQPLGAQPSYYQLWETQQKMLAACGGSCTLWSQSFPNDPAGERYLLHLIIAYPLSGELFVNLFEKAGFGVDEWWDPATGIQEPGLNTLGRILERRQVALDIYRGIASECDVILSAIGKTSATLMTPVLPERDWATKWGQKVWEFYKTNYSAGKAADIHPVHSFTKNDCLRLARKHGVFMLGGY